MLQTSQDEYTCRELAKSLGKILQGGQFPKVVTALKDCLTAQVYEKDFDRYELIWHCAQNITYPDFYQAWHN